jgi:DNA-binding NarL/FixJ family response regulator
MAAVSVAEGLGFRAVASAATDREDLQFDVEGRTPDVVVLVLNGGPSNTPVWSASGWRKPARLTAAFRQAGAKVLAVSAGAGAGALATCVEQGASALFDLDELPAELRALCAPGTNDATFTSRLTSGHRMPPRFEALVHLTASERRVLFYLTEGWTAQDIADDLVVSLTTVRSHIRSILRKLDVRSQLAAVAIANSRDPALDDADLIVNLPQV